MDDLQEQAEKARDCLEKAVAELFERKRRLGEYAVIYKDGKPTRIIPGESPEERDSH